MISEPDGKGCIAFGSMPDQVMVMKPKYVQEAIPDREYPVRSY